MRLPERAKPSPRGQSTLPVPSRSLVRFTSLLWRSTTFPFNRRLGAAGLGLLYYSSQFSSFLLRPKHFMVPWFSLNQTALQSFAFPLSSLPEVNTECSEWSHLMASLTRDTAKSEGTAIILGSTGPFYQTLFRSPWEHSLLSTRGRSSVTRPEQTFEKVHQDMQ